MEEPMTAKQVNRVVGDALADARRAVDVLEAAQKEWSERREFNTLALVEEARSELGAAYGKSKAVQALLERRCWGPDGKATVQGRLKGVA
jgi:hypothetical protein